MDLVPLLVDAGCSLVSEFGVDWIWARPGAEKETAVAARMVGARSGVLALLNSHKLVEPDPADTKEMTAPG
ncbi:hypothetical protein ACPPTR_06180 [Ralstonia pseudosolanacearum]|uniref:hypothetical protein n=1 Tax=Ralstonia pseudosolanacearum TaxID=1310165 RepID=UPI001E54440C|nr:hypothetical protein [Ralstonia pseudosolanacearum]